MVESKTESKVSLTVQLHDTVAWFQQQQKLTREKQDPELFNLYTLLDFHDEGDVDPFFLGMPTVLKPAFLPGFEDILAYSQWPEPKYVMQPPVLYFPLRPCARPPEKQKMALRPLPEPSVTDPVEQAALVAEWNKRPLDWIVDRPLQREQATLFLQAVTFNDELKLAAALAEARAKQQQIDAKFDEEMATYKRLSQLCLQVLEIQRWQEYQKAVAANEAYDQSMKEYKAYLAQLRVYPPAFHGFNREQEIVKWWKLKDSCKDDSKQLRQAYKEYQVALAKNTEEVRQYNLQAESRRAWWVKFTVLEHGARFRPHLQLRFKVHDVKPGLCIMPPDLFGNYSQIPLTAKSVAAGHVTSLAVLGNSTFEVVEDHVPEPVIRLTFLPEWHPSFMKGTTPCIITLAVN